MIFSANMLKTYKNCPKKYEFRYIDNFNLPQNAEIFERGKKIHALAHYYLQGTDVKKFENALTPDEKILWERLKSNKYFNLKTYGTEYELNCKVGKFGLAGAWMPLFMMTKVTITFSITKQEQFHMNPKTTCKQ